MTSHEQTYLVLRMQELRGLLGLRRMKEDPVKRGCAREKGTQDPGVGFGSRRVGLRDKGALTRRVKEPHTMVREGVSRTAELRHEDEHWERG